MDDLNNYSEHILDTISANVKCYWELNDLSQIKLALEIGMTGGAYFAKAELRKPKHRFNIIHLAKISKVLDVPISAFFEPLED